VSDLADYVHFLDSLTLHVLLDPGMIVEQRTNTLQPLLKDNMVPRPNQEQSDGNNPYLFANYNGAFYFRVLSNIFNLDEIYGDSDLCSSLNTHLWEMIRLNKR